MTLKGEVDSWQEKQLATEVAKGVAGVRKINNEIVFNFKYDRPDEEIRADIVRRIESDVWIVDLLIQVHVDKGNVSLTGAVGSVAEKIRAGQLAWVAGVKEVDNSNLSVNSGINDETKRTGPAGFRTDDEIKTAIEEAFLYDLRVNPFNPKVKGQPGICNAFGCG